MGIRQMADGSNAAAALALNEIRTTENDVRHDLCARHRSCLTYSHTSNKVIRTRVADREKGAHKRIAERCERLGLKYYIQTDCRGLALYLSREEINDQNYNSIGYGVG
jgi:hypothetical protein